LVSFFIFSILTSCPCFPENKDNIKKLVRAFRKTRTTKKSLSVLSGKQGQYKIACPCFTENKNNKKKLVRVFRKTRKMKKSLSVLSGKQGKYKIACPCFLK